jgi:hypothetical protein
MIADRSARRCPGAEAPTPVASIGSTAGKNTVGAAPERTGGWGLDWPVYDGKLLLTERLLRMGIRAGAGP